MVFGPAMSSAKAFFLASARLLDRNFNENQFTKTHLRAKHTKPIIIQLIENEWLTAGLRITTVVGSRAVGQRRKPTGSDDNSCKNQEGGVQRAHSRTNGSRAGKEMPPWKRPEMVGDRPTSP
ncbi:hypothetical protein E3N88_15970 [Mikania micrantha]|uniref:Uncharacterized protein n=1 Tax=Mikania micrantha TaxID=192012 RepID=A0A5N6NWX7_9ASTR|nr:hypothetical protein E3N88_15970 [Mikania micrantha]